MHIQWSACYRLIYPARAIFNELGASFEAICIRLQYNSHTNFCREAYELFANRQSIAPVAHCHLSFVVCTHAGNKLICKWNRKRPRCSPRPAGYNKHGPVALSRMGSHSLIQSPRNRSVPYDELSTGSQTFQLFVLPKQINTINITGNLMVDSKSNSFFRFSKKKMERFAVNLSLIANG